MAYLLRVSSTTGLMVLENASNTPTGLALSYSCTAPSTLMLMPLCETPPLLTIFTWPATVSPGEYTRLYLTPRPSLLVRRSHPLAILRHNDSLLQTLDDPKPQHRLDSTASGSSFALGRTLIVSARAREPPSCPVGDCDFVPHWLASLWHPFGISVRWTSRDGVRSTVRAMLSSTEP